MELKAVNGNGGHKAKYIVIDNGSNVFPVVFPDFLNHDDMARNVGGEVISAGFVEVMEDHVYTGGRSTSLQLKSREEDQDMLTRLLIMS